MGGPGHVRAVTGGVASPYKSVLHRGQYLLGDKGMLLSRNLIGPFKETEITGAADRNFNYQLARLWVKSEHAIGILKGRWSSLKELRLSLLTDKQFSFALAWIMACVVLHNVCLEKGNRFP